MPGMPCMPPFPPWTCVKARQNTCARMSCASCGRSAVVRTPIFQQARLTVSGGISGADYSVISKSRHGLRRAWQLWYSGVPMKFAQVCQVGSRWFTMARPWANGPSWPKKFCKKGRRLWQDWAIDRDQTMGVRHEGLLEGNGGSDCSHRLLPGCSLVLGRFTTTNCG